MKRAPIERAAWCLLLLAALVACGPPPTPMERLAASTTPSDVKILLIGIDGATLRVLQPLVDGDELPTFAKLMREGSYGTLQSRLPIRSPVIWTTLATGVPREEHGIQAFRAQGRESLVASTDRQRLALWNLLPPFDKSVGFTGWWVTWPAEPVQGWMVSDRLARGRWTEWLESERGGMLTYPPELAQELAPLVVSPDDAPYEEIAQLARFTEDELQQMRAATKPLRSHWLSVIKFAFCAQRSYEEIALHLLARQQPDLSSVFLIANDPVSHTFWHFFEPDRFPEGSVDPQMAARLGSAVPGMYRHNDRYLERLLELVDKQTVVIIVSDHGFKPSGKVPGAASDDEHDATDPSLLSGETVTVGQSGVHHRGGLIIASGGPILSSVKINAKLLDLAPTVLALMGLPVPDDMPGRVLEEIVEPGFWQQHPIQRIDSYEQLIPREILAGEGIDDEEALEMLRALGYIQ